MSERSNSDNVANLGIGPASSASTGSKKHSSVPSSSVASTYSQAPPTSVPRQSPASGNRTLFPGAMANATLTSHLSDTSYFNDKKTDNDTITAVTGSSDPCSRMIVMGYNLHEDEGYHSPTDVHIVRILNLLEESPATDAYNRYKSVSHWWRKLRMDLHRYDILELDTSGTPTASRVQGDAENAMVDGALATLPDKARRLKLVNEILKTAVPSEKTFAGLHHAVQAVDPAPDSLDFVETFLDCWTLDHNARNLIDPSTPHAYRELRSVLETYFCKLQKAHSFVPHLAWILKDIRVYFPDFYETIHYELARFDETPRMLVSKSAYEKVLGKIQATLDRFIRERRRESQRPANPKSHRR